MVLEGSPHIHDIEDIEELSPELDDNQFASGLTLSYGRVLYEREIEVVEGRASKGVSPQGAETSLVWTSSPRAMDGD